MPLPGKEIRVCSWIELVKELHSNNVVPIQPGSGDHHRSPYLFRGMDNAKWELTTSLQFLAKKPGPDTFLVERALIRAFRKYANAGAFDEKSAWYVMAAAQHNGLPTRCLDWTSSPFVAAHFACSDERRKQDDGVIWCLDCGVLRDINERSTSMASGLKGLAWVYDTRLLEKAFRDPEAFTTRLLPGAVMLVWEPPSIDARIANQCGLFTIMNHPDDSPNAFLLKHCAQCSDLVLRFVIDAKAKPEIRDMLDQNGVTERTLFPGLPGLCQYLKRYYAKVW